MSIVALQQSHGGEVVEADRRVVDPSPQLDGCFDVARRRAASHDEDRPICFARARRFMPAVTARPACTRRFHWQNAVIRTVSNAPPRVRVGSPDRVPGVESHPAHRNETGLREPHLSPKAPRSETLRMLLGCRRLLNAAEPGPFSVGLTVDKGRADSGEGTSQMREGSNAGPASAEHAPRVRAHQIVVSVQDELSARLDTRRRQREGPTTRASR